MLRPLLISSSVLGISILTVFAGCSSSSTKVTGGNDSGSAADVVHNDSSSSSGSGSSSGSSSGGTGDDASGDDGGGTCSENVAYTYPGYVTIVPSTTDCTSADITAFEAACTGPSASGTLCDNWQTANLPGADGGGGTACGTCIFGNYNPPTSIGQGAAYVTCDSLVATTPNDATCLFEPNVIGCVQLIDPTNGPACAAADDALTQCESWECNGCSDTAMGGPLDSACITAVDADQCASFLTAAQTKCAADFGDGGAGTAFSKCDPSGGTNSSEDFTFIIGQMCGGGTIVEAGAGG